jgi:hypothetical protein
MDVGTIACHAKQAIDSCTWMKKGLYWGKKIRKVGVNIYLETAGSLLN